MTVLPPPSIAERCRKRGLALKPHSSAESGFAGSAIDRTHSAEAPWPMKGHPALASLPFTHNGRKLFAGRCNNFLNRRNTFRLKSDPVNFLSAGFGAKLPTGDKQSACLGYEHPTIFASDHLRRASFAPGCARPAARRRRQEPPDKAKSEVRQNAIDYESEIKHCSET